MSKDVYSTGKGKCERNLVRLRSLEACFSVLSSIPGGNAVPSDTVEGAATAYMQPDFWRHLGCKQPLNV